MKTLAQAEHLAVAFSIKIEDCKISEEAQCASIVGFITALALIFEQDFASLNLRIVDLYSSVPHA